MGIPPERILDATAQELEFFAVSRERYFEDCEIIIMNAIVKVLNQIEEARR